MLCLTLLPDFETLTSHLVASARLNTKGFAQSYWNVICHVWWIFLGGLSFSERQCEVCESEGWDVVRTKYMRGKKEKDWHCLKGIRGCDLVERSVSQGMAFKVSQIQAWSSVSFVPFVPLPADLAVELSAPFQHHVCLHSAVLLTMLRKNGNSEL